MNDAASTQATAVDTGVREMADFVSVVIPAADEAANIPLLLKRVYAVLNQCATKHEVIVVVPSPQDPTGDVARSAGAKVLVQKRPGYGGALKEGILATHGRYIVTMDADLSHPPEKIAELLEHRDEAEIIVCSRYVAGGSAQMSQGREILSRILNLVYSRVLAVPVRDMSSGFRLYQSHIFNELTISGEKYDVLEEILVKTYTLGWKVAEIAFDYMPRASGVSHASALGFAPQFLATLFHLFKIRNHFQSADYDSRAYNSRLLPQRYWQRRRHKIITEMVGQAEPRLDVGCGSSHMIQSSPATIGLDIARPKLRFLRSTNPLLVQGDTFHLPFSDGTFEAMIHSEVLEFIPDDRRVFTELNRVLKIGGTLVIATPDYARVQWRVIELLYKYLLPNSYRDQDITHYTRHKLTEALADAGFGVIRYQYIMGGELIIRCAKREELSPSNRR